MTYPIRVNTLSLAVVPQPSPEREDHRDTMHLQSGPSISATGSTVDILQGSSPAMVHLRSQIQRVAPYFRTALLTGERGCGEEHIARALHQISPLASRPFIELTALEAELRFGNSSLLESHGTSPVASEGMIFLPHPEQLPRSSQFALQRVLRSRSFLPPCIVAFAERGLRPLVSSGNLLPELAESLSALRITVPALRDRPEDIPALLLNFLQSLTPTPPRLSPDLLDAASKLPWPNNFSQIGAVARQLLKLDTELLRAEHLHSVYGTMPQAQPNDRREIRLVRLDQVIQEHIRAVLFACNGNKLRAAEVLGISRSTLYRMLDAASPDQAMQLVG